MEKIREEKLSFIEVLKSFWKADEEEVSELDGELASTPKYVQKLEKEITTYDDKKKRKKKNYKKQIQKYLMAFMNNKEMKNR